LLDGPFIDDAPASIRAQSNSKPSYGLRQTVRLACKDLFRNGARDDGRERLSSQRLRFCYEAGPCGYGLHRQIKALGHECVVVAPSLIPMKAGDRIKTDRRDAAMLAKLHCAGELTAVWIPDAAHEAMRDLIRARNGSQGASSGTAIRRGGITKAGNALARRVLIEGAWTYRMQARVSRKLHDRLEGLPQIVRDIAWKAQVRLCSRYRRLVATGKPKVVVTTAIAREMGDFSGRLHAKRRSVPSPDFLRR
jgi:transposase